MEFESEDTTAYEPTAYEPTAYVDFEKELYDLKQEFYEVTMSTPPSLEQEPLIAFILKEDLFRIGVALRNYINGHGIVIPLTSVSHVFKEADKSMTDDIYRYASERQSLMKKMMTRATEVIDKYPAVPNMIKKEYVNDIFYKYIWNIAPATD
jgi:hypothetical protein